MKIFRDASWLMNKALQFYVLTTKTRLILKTKLYLVWEMNLICWKLKMVMLSRKVLKSKNKSKFCELRYQNVTKKSVMFVLRSRWQLATTSHANVRSKFCVAIYKNSKELDRDNNLKFINWMGHCPNGNRNVLHKIQGLGF